MVRLKLNWIMEMLSNYLFFFDLLAFFTHKLIELCEEIKINSERAPEIVNKHS